MALLQGTDGSGDASWVTTLTDDLTLSGTITASALLVPDAAVAVGTNAAPPTPTSATSGTIYRVDTSGGVTTIALPVGVVGQTYTFVLSDATNDLTINCDAVASSMLGLVAIQDIDGVENSSSAAANGTTHDRLLLDIDGGGGAIQVGSWVKFTCLVGGAGTSVWFVEGVVQNTSGAATACVVFSSNP